MSQMLRKPQLEEEGELVVLADYGDGSHSSDAKPDTRVQEGVKPRILLVGLRRSGKSSIQKVVFHKMSPKETLFLVSMKKICREEVSNSSWTGALLFVIDSQDDYMEALARIHLKVTRAYKVNSDINFKVFIHKVDDLANDDLADAGTVVQELIPQLPTLENLLNIFISNFGIEKLFLFDVVSKIYIATDSTPVDMKTYELCCDMMIIIKLNNTTVLYLKEETKFLALVCSLIDYNFHCFRKAIHGVFEVRMKVMELRKVQNWLQKKTGATLNRTPRVLL
ncbi:hypothetical protein FD755_019644 [Muntiacus reevesi]|uniref:Ras-related GTP-binding protein n=1 Tax=Muntiacus reevesi TaxID=9886 RepID=A0A5N3X346_MUNRE|nr:hypothetical protein FD755_019644 [Muntiacus reevesi]